MLDVDDGLAAVRAALGADGLLMLQDPALPCIATLVSGERVRGSWWGHPAGGTIFAVANALAEDPDVTTMRLVAGKITFVQRPLWAEVIAIGRARAPWQLHGLSPSATALLQRVGDEGELEATGADTKLLAARLLVHGNQRHGETGHHRGVLQSWAHFAEQHGVHGRMPAVDAARARLETAVQRWANGVRAPLPWQSKR